MDARAFESPPTQQWSNSCSLYDVTDNTNSAHKGCIKYQHNNCLSCLLHHAFSAMLQRQHPTVGTACRSNAAHSSHDCTPASAILSCTMPLDTGCASGSGRNSTLLLQSRLLSKPTGTPCGPLQEACTDMPTGMAA